MPYHPAPPRGRPRNESAQRKILATTLRLVLKHGFRTLTIDRVAGQSGIAKTSIYRRWPNKAAMVMDAFLETVEAETPFPSTSRAVDSLRAQLSAQAKLFRGKLADPIRALLGEAQFDEELAAAFHERWISPRRVRLKSVIEEAMKQGDLRADLDPEVAMDQLYAPLYYRLMVSSGQLDETYVEQLFQQVCGGLSR